MPDGSLEIPVLSYEQLRAESEKFAQKYNRLGTIPVPIEEIAEFSLELAISPEMSLQYICDVDAFINAACTTIHIDAEVYLCGNRNRCRFSFAHEVAHYLLHREVMQRLQFKSMAEWKQVQASIPAKTHDWLEWQAYSLGGLILVPTQSLAAEYKKADALVRADDPEQTNKDVIRYGIEGILAAKFSVSREVIQRRCTKDHLVEQCKD